MPRSLLPPRGVFVSSYLVYDKDIPPTVRDSWVQLRGLAWGRLETPSLSIQTISELTGKHKSAIYEHLRLLQARGALRWHPGSKSEIIVVFPEDDNFQLSENMEKLNVNNQEVKFKDTKKTLKGDGFQNSGKLEKIKIPAEILKPIISALSEVTGMDLKANYSRLSAAAKKLALSNYTGDQVITYYSKIGGNSVWYKQDWRGRKGDRPTPEAIYQTIKGFTDVNRGADTFEARVAKEKEAAELKWAAAQEEDDEKNI